VLYLGTGNQETRLEMQREKATMNRADRNGLSRAAFTMIEVMVSAFLIALIMCGAYLLITRAATLSRVARNHYVAISLSRNRLEHARTMDYNSLALLAENNVIVDDNGTPCPGATFSRTTTVNTNYSADPAVKLTQISVVVKIRNIRTGQFTGEQEAESKSLYTDFSMPAL
jgi:prepilin-type N-terminal cleavage/methylation domain-containing protein